MASAYTLEFEKPLLELERQIEDLKRIGTERQIDIEGELPGLTPWRRGKVRRVYEAGPDHLLIVATDRLSAYDSVLPTPIPEKGIILTRLSGWWMRTLASAAPHHLVSDDPAEYPAPFREHAERLRGRSQLVRRAERIDIECVVRGYLTGSGWKEYRQNRAVCGIALSEGLHDGSRLDPPIFTPATKEDSGHDMNIPFEEVVTRCGAATESATTGVFQAPPMRLVYQALSELELKSLPKTTCGMPLASHTTWGELYVPDPSGEGMISTVPNVPDASRV